MPEEPAPNTFPAATVVLLSPTSSLRKEPLPAGVVVVAASFQNERKIDLAKVVVPLGGGGLLAG